MELVRGVTMTQFCDDAKLYAAGRGWSYSFPCAWRSSTHQKGIIHRDIKPTNVLVTMSDGKPLPKVIDFGVAKATGGQLTEKTLFTNFAQMIGTPLYMIPGANWPERRGCGHAQRHLFARRAAL